MGFEDFPAHLRSLVELVVFDARTAGPAILNREARRIVEALGLPGSCEVDMLGEVTLEAPKNTERLRGASSPRRGRTLRARGAGHRLRPATGHGGRARGRAHVHRARTAAHPLGECGTGDDSRRPPAPGLGAARGRGREGGAQLREEAPPKLGGGGYRMPKPGQV